MSALDSSVMQSPPVRPAPLILHPVRVPTLQSAVRDALLSVPDADVDKADAATQAIADAVAKIESTQAKSIAANQLAVFVLALAVAPAWLLALAALFRRRAPRQPALSYPAYERATYVAISRVGALLDDNAAGEKVVRTLMDEGWTPPYITTVS